MAGINQEIIDNFDHVIQEKGNTYVALRQVRWKPEGPVSYDIRKYITQSDGSEMINKGCSLTHEGLDELTNVLTREGFGDTKEILDNIQDRPDFPVSLVKSLSHDNMELVSSTFPDMKLPTVEEDEFYDIRKELEGNG